MFRSIGAWVRLAIVLSALWLLGIGLYAGYAWSNALDVDSPFVYYVTPAPDGGWYRVNREQVQSGQRLEGPFVHPIWRLWAPEPRFKWSFFLIVVGGVFAGIWVVIVGPVWVIKGFQRQPEKKAEPTG
ncbi:MAG: hypothetical protein HYS12_19095 [Planctomycetes bacterium]|nr:hypothetical protein [Planctomycetota bacterium]